nr:putative ribonuclease H-like domain-containing protein [Tanacetum cinerariifolium]
PYELFHGRTPTLSFMRPFGCPVTILNTKDNLGKFDGKTDEGFFVGYFLNSKAFRVFNSRTKILEENLHIRFSENTPNDVASGPDWPFDIDALTRTMNYEPIVADSKSSQDDGFNPSSDDGKKVDEDSSKGNECNDQEKEDNVNITNNVNTISSTVNAAGTNKDNELPFDPNMPALEDASIFNFLNDDDEDDIVAGMNNMDTTIQVSLVLTTRIHIDHPLDQVIGDFHSATQTRNMSKNLEEHGFVSTIQLKTHKDLQNCTKWDFKNKKDERGIMIRNNARLVAKGHTQKEGIDYDEVFALVARIVAISLFVAYASFKDFMVYQMDVKSVFLYWKIEKEVYACQPPRFEDPDFPVRVYKVEKALYGLHQAPRAWLMHDKFQLSSMGELTFFLRLQVKQKNDGIFISQDKYVAKILKKFWFRKVKNASTPIETQKPLLKDEDGDELDVHMYRSMIGSLMYLTSLRLDIKFVMCTCARYKVNPKVSHLHAVKRIFMYLKGQPKLGLWYPKYSPFNLVAYTDSDYAGASLDRKSTTGGKAKKNVRWMMEKLFGMELELILLLWSTAMAKTINREAQIYAWVDGKEIIITESSVRRDLRLADEEGVDCLSNSTIFKTLELMGKLEKKQRSRTHKLKRLYKRKINDIDANKDITLVNDQDDDEMFDVNDLHGEDVFVEKEVADKMVNDEVQKVVEEVVKDTNTVRLNIDAAQVSAAGEVNAASIAITKSQDKGKAIMIEELVKHKKKDQIRLDEEAALKLLQPEEQQELTNEEKATLFMQLLEKRRKFFAAKRAKDKRNKPPTQAHQRKIMCTYLKNVEGKKLKDLKNKSFNSIQKMFDRAFKRVNTFVDFKTELVESSLKRAGEELIQESTKKQKVEDDKETVELKQLMEIIPDEEEVATDAVPLDIKSLKIVD